MRFVTIMPQGAQASDQAPSKLPADGFIWCDCPRSESLAWVAVTQALTGVQIFGLHLQDVENPVHPSHFDSTADYERIIFRGLIARAGSSRSAVPEREDIQAATAPDNTGDRSGDERTGRKRLRLRTAPAIFFLLPGMLITIRGGDNSPFDLTYDRLVGSRASGVRMPLSPAELMLRILNGIVDGYLALRQPLTEVFERHQRALLDPRRPYRDWYELLETRRQATRLQNLCEEQLDAIQEWRDERLERDELSDALQVRASDLVEHIDRVLTHATRMEASVEAAVQIHFSATAHRTNEVMRTLTAITAIFLPLNLITGIFGMNFASIPGLHSPVGFWWTMGLLVLLGLGLLGLFRARAYIQEPSFNEARDRRNRRRLKLGPRRPDRKNPTGQAGGDATHGRPD